MRYKLLVGMLLLAAIVGWAMLYQFPNDMASVVYNAVVTAALVICTSEYGLFLYRTNTKGRVL